MNSQKALERYEYMAGEVFPSLSSVEQAVLNQLFLRSVRSGGESFSLDIPCLSKSANVSLLSARKAIASLSKQGLIAVPSKGSAHRATVFEVLFVDKPVPTKAIEKMPLSKALGLDFPYDWSNVNMTEDALIAKVLDRARFADILRICAHFGTEKIESVAKASLDKDKTPEVRSMIANIKQGRERASKS